MASTSGVHDCILSLCLSLFLPLALCLASNRTQVSAKI
jgi:hypothetical protein